MIVFMTFLLWALGLILTAYAFFPAVSLFFSMMNRRRKIPANDSALSFACIITAYKDFSIALPQVRSILAQQYPDYHIYLVADHCKRPDNLPEHRELSFLFPDPYLNSKVMSIRFAMDRFVRKHDVILILDADNLLQANALCHFNRYIQAGFTAVQGQRTAKNLDTTVAALDALGELYYNVIQRDTPFRIGSSATIAGSGMAVRTSFFKKYIDRLFAENKQFEIAEDKLLQMMLVQHQHRIAYCRDALIFDEKVTHGAQVQRQRTRWIRSWFQHWSSAIRLTLSGLRHLDWNIFYFGLMLSFPPMFMLVGGLVLILATGWLLNPWISLLSLTGLVVFSLQFLLALMISPAPPAIWRAIPKIPVFVWRQVLAVLKIQASKNDFMATDHDQHMEIREVWENRKKDFPWFKGC